MNRHSRIAHSGILLLLTMLVTLSLLGFGVLSLSVAKQDLALTRRHAEETRLYYEAMGKAQAYLASQEAQDAPENEVEFFVGENRVLTLRMAEDAAEGGKTVLEERWETVTPFSYDETLHLLGAQD